MKLSVIVGMFQLIGSMNSSLSLEFKKGELMFYIACGTVFNQFILMLLMKAETMIFSLTFNDASNEA